MAAIMHIHRMGELVIRLLMILTYLYCLTSYAHASSGIRSISESYRRSQQSMKDAANTKSIERVLRNLAQADEAIHSVRKQIHEYTAITGAEQRMVNRISAKLLEDEKFLKAVKVDMGLAEVDSIESYVTLRRSLLQDPEQREYVLKMDLQILLALEKQGLSES